jgi:Grap2 and cyclin-D-interacting
MATGTPPTSSTVIQKLTTIRILSSHLENGIRSDTEEGDHESHQPDALSSLRNASAVFKAQTTKLGLLLVNKPLTPSAIYTILDDVEKRVLPTFFGPSSYICSRKDIFGGVFTAEVSSILQKVFGTVGPLADAVEEVFKGSGNVDKDRVMLVVGKIYTACDVVTDLVNKGVPGVLLRKVNEWTALMEDAFAELKEWSEDIDEDSCEDGDSGDDDAESEAERHEAIEELLAGLSMGGSKRLPGHRSDLINLLTESLRRVDLIIKLCQATSKRRVKKFPFQTPPFGSKDIEMKRTKDMTVLNGMVLAVEQMQCDLDELAAAFYDLNVDLVRTYITKLSRDAEAIAESSSTDWDGREDDFTKWTQTWRKLINKNSLSSDEIVS